MQTVRVRELMRKPSEFTGEAIRVSGWIRTTRDSKAFGFIELNDGSFFKNIQVVLDASKIDTYAQVIKYPVGAAIEVTANFVQTPDAPQPCELQALEVKLLGDCDSDYPLQKKRHSLEYLRTIAHLRPRTNTFSAVFRLRSQAAFLIHQFFNQRGFVYVHTPIITASDCEGAGEMFHVTSLDIASPPRDNASNVAYEKDFFSKPANLTVSGQLNVETHCMALRDVYTFGPTFRAENSNTARHAAEFWMIEPEIAFAGLDEDMSLAEDMVKYVLSGLLESLPEEMEFFNKFVDKTLLNKLNHLVDAKFERITYTEAIAQLQKSGESFQFPVHWGMDMQTEHERCLTEKIFSGPVFVTDYPKDIKAFYMRMNEDEKTVAAMDMLVPGIGELIGGSQREERFDRLKSRIEQMGLDAGDYSWYLDLRKYGGVKHAGFGLGFERLLMYASGMQNIRDVISFPRVAGSAEF